MTIQEIIDQMERLDTALAEHHKLAKAKAIHETERFYWIGTARHDLHLAKSSLKNVEVTA